MALCMVLHPTCPLCMFPFFFSGDWQTSLRATSFVAGEFWEPLHLFKPCSNVLLELRLLSHGHHVDRWQNVSNNKSWHCLISLVGYGDIVCKTKMGRVLQLLSLLVGLVRYLYLDWTFWLLEVDFVHSQALFASVLPEILELLGQQSKWAGAYHGTKGKRYNFCLSGIWLCTLYLNPM